MQQNHEPSYRAGSVRTTALAVIFVATLALDLGSGHDDCQALCDGDEVNEEIECMLDVISVARMCLLNDGLCVIEDKAAEDEEPSIENEGERDKGGPNGGEEADDDEAEEGGKAEGAEEEVGATAGQDGGNGAAGKDGSGTSEGDGGNARVDRRDEGKQGCGCGTIKKGEEMEERGSPFGLGWLPIEGEEDRQCEQGRKCDRPFQATRVGVQGED